VDRGIKSRKRPSITRASHDKESFSMGCWHSQSKGISDKKKSEEGKGTKRRRDVQVFDQKSWRRVFFLQNRVKSKRRRGLRERGGGVTTGSFKRALPVNLSLLLVRGKSWSMSGFSETSFFKKDPGGAEGGQG